MRKFQFRFEAVGKMKKLHEDTVLRELAVVQKRMQMLLNEKILTTDALNSAILRREQLGEHGTKIYEFQIEDHFIQGSKIRIKRLEALIQTAQKSCDRVMKKFIEARKKRMAIDHLKELDHRRYRKERNRLEMKRLDEVYTSRAKREGRA